MSETVLMEASKQWASRPSDQRFLSLEELRRSVEKRKNESWTVAPRLEDLRAVPTNGGIALNVYDPTHGEQRQLFPTNWAFGQLAQYAQAPATYLRQLAPELAAINLQYGFEHRPLKDDALILAHSNGEHSVRSVTSTSYGRIYDLDVVKSVERANHDGRWQIPAASYSATNPKRATTLYASDRDVFIFMVDPKNEIEVNGDKLYRGFMVWNSEVGAATFGLSTFLYRTVCDNRMVWGATQVNELRIRHTKGAPERFAHEGAKYLKRYAEESAAETVAVIKNAQEKKVPVGKDKTMEEWLRDRGFTKAQAKASVDTAVAEEGSARTFWEICNGITAFARSIDHTDERVDLEIKAGRILALAA